MAQAEEFPRLLDSGEVHSRAELAHRFRISAMWVTDILRLLKLHPPIQEAVRGLGPETPPRLVCERKLRGVAELPADEQLRAAAEFVPGLIARGPETPRGQVARSRSSAGP